MIRNNLSCDRKAEYYSACTLCPRQCGVNRRIRNGYCRQGADICAARAGLHYYEEPFFSGCHGSGTVFFSGCTLQCVFCQNYEISGTAKKQEISDSIREVKSEENCVSIREPKGVKIPTERLAEIFLELQQAGAHNINLVTGTSFIPSIAEALQMIKGKELTIPVIWNSSGYEKPEALSCLGDLIDIWMPDLKTLSAAFAQKYLHAEDYPDAAAAAIDYMVHITPEPVFETEYFEEKPVVLMKKGVLVRHLVMPGNIRGAEAVLQYLYNRYGNRIWISLMNQYTPNGQCRFKEINRPVSKREYDRAVNSAISLGITNCLIQEGGTISDSFVPAFDGTGILP